MSYEVANVLSVKLICVGRLKEKFYLAAAAEYQKRLSSCCRLTVEELAEERRPQNASAADIRAALEKEAGAIERALLPRSLVVALCIEGETLTSEAFAEMLGEAANGASSVCFVIGSSDGLAPSIKARADRRVSMSAMTFPHHLARIMLLEQLYRGFSIRRGGRYHK